MVSGLTGLSGVLIITNRFLVIYHGIFSMASERRLPELCYHFCCELASGDAPSSVAINLGDLRLKRIS